MKIDQRTITVYLPDWNTNIITDATPEECRCNTAYTDKWITNVAVCF